MAWESAATLCQRSILVDKVTQCAKAAVSKIQLSQVCGIKLYEGMTLTMAVANVFIQ